MPEAGGLCPTVATVTRCRSACHVLFKWRLPALPACNRTPRPPVSRQASTDDTWMKSLPPLSISTDKVCFVIIKAREFDVKDVVTDPDSGSNAADDGMVSVLEDHGDDPVAQEITGFIRAMTEDEQIDLVALAWL